MEVLGIFVRLPRSGECKTRLASVLGPVEAAELYAAFVGDVVHRFQRTGDRRYLCYSPDTPDAARFFRELAGGCYGICAQSSGSLGERMGGFFQAMFDAGDTRVVLIGSDAPTLPVDYVDRAFAILKERDFVFGPATDGGYYLIGARRGIERISDRPAWFDGIQWSSPAVLAQSVERIRSIGRSLDLLPPWYDVDTADDVEMLRGHLAALRLSGQACATPRTQRWLDAAASGKPGLGSPSASAGETGRGGARRIPP